MFEYDEYEKYLDHDRKIYTGKRYSSNKESIDIMKLIKKGSICYRSMKVRTSDDSKLKKYAGLGVHFSQREFLYWWIIQNRFFKMNISTVGRIDHSKGYYFDNIILQEKSDNSKEARIRNGQNFQSRKVNIFYSGALIAEASSLYQAAQCSKLRKSAIEHQCKKIGNESLYKSNWSFRFASK